MLENVFTTLAGNEMTNESIYCRSLPMHKLDERKYRSDILLDFSYNFMYMALNYTMKILFSYF